MFKLIYGYLFQNSNRNKYSVIALKHRTSLWHVYRIEHANQSTLCVTDAFTANYTGRVLSVKLSVISFFSGSLLKAADRESVASDQLTV